MFVCVGFNNCVNKNQVVAVCNFESEPIKRMVRAAEDANKLIDQTCGRRCRSVLVMRSGHVVKAHLKPESLLARLNGN